MKMEPTIANIIGGWEIVLVVIMFGVPASVIGAIRLARRGEVVPADGSTATPASVGLRYLAKVIDLVAVLGPSMLVASAADEATGGLMIIFGWLLYNWLMVAIWGATLGKLMVGAVVVDKSDHRCGWGRAFCRALLEYTYLLPFIWLISVIALGVSKVSRSALDSTVGTKVVRRDSVRHLFARAMSAPEPHLVSPRTHPGDFEQQLRKLARLRDDGLITEIDFDRKKREILGL